MPAVFSRRGWLRDLALAPRLLTTARPPPLMPTGNPVGLGL